LWLETKFILPLAEFLFPSRVIRKQNKGGYHLDYQLIGESAAMKMLKRQIHTAARCDLPVLVSGESGTGKELVARAIRLQSSRAKTPFVSLNCGALTETLLESELFGYERGAFTGAVQKKKGLFEAAHTGTIFLDEIAEMSTSCQVKLLRVLQERAFRPVGGHVETSIDVRVIAATNRDLAQEMAAGRFREDLYYRIAVLTISTPALRERRLDIRILIEHFLDQAQETLMRSRKHTIEPSAVAALSVYAWPGNVRQLKNVVERLVATASEGATITMNNVYKALPATTLPTTALLDPTWQLLVAFHEGDSLDDFLDQTMLSLYEQVLSKTGSHSQAARLLCTDRVSLYQRIERARRRLQLAKPF
jgi:transcriptional regulator with PAS, ATPase and Fis domain